VRLEGAYFRLYIYLTKKLRTNQEIRALTIRLIGGEDEQIGVMPVEKALALAAEAETDLVEVAPKAMPPVCKLMDYGKYLYRLNKTEQKHKQNQHKTEVKGVRIGFNTGAHDLEIRLNQARGFLSKKNLVKVVLMLRGREAAYKSAAVDKVKEFAEKLNDVGVLESYPKAQGYQVIGMIKPLA
jgi:translation initiation factor IF-3